MSVVAILGSARGESHTQALLLAVLAGRSATRIDLRDLTLRHYEYDSPAGSDDFGQVVDAMIAHDRIVFVTPVYWYAMSGRMKVLFDRFTELVTRRKDLGRQLKGREVVVLACGSDLRLPEGFEVPFRETTTYLGMVYRGTFYAQTEALGLTPSAVREAAVFGAAQF